jgi:hypothetical protein
MPWLAMTSPVCHGGGLCSIQSQSMWYVCGVKSCTGAGSSPSISVFPCQYYSSSSPYSSICTFCCYQKDKMTKPGNLRKRSALLETGEHWIEKYFHFSVFKGLNSMFPLIPTHITIHRHGMALASYHIISSVCSGYLYGYGINVLVS